VDLSFGDFVFFAGVALGNAIGFQDVGGAASGGGVGETSDRADLRNRENIDSSFYCKIEGVGVLCVIWWIEVCRYGGEWIKEILSSELTSRNFEEVAIVF
jgi:hypothetical protein